LDALPIATTRRCHAPNSRPCASMRTASERRPHDPHLVLVAGQLEHFSGGHQREEQRQDTHFVPTELDQANLVEFLLPSVRLVETHLHCAASRHCPPVPDIFPLRPPCQRTCGDVDRLPVTCVNKFWGPRFLQRML